ncbi:MAG: trimeric intracellular cation channel family protein [Christensenellaceae bacterium]|nr:trimeric intracellular cation channel family protein [Christensenellaceae bacterium]
MKLLLLIMEYLGTIAFAISGASLAIRKGMDYLGVVALGIITATGGGLIRDIILNRFPAAVFVNKAFAFLAFITSTILFIFLYFNKHILTSKRFYKFELLVNIFDSIGLGIFTVVGAMVAYHLTPRVGIVLTLFAGVITGVGGGIIRDVCSLSMPYVFTKHIYASASLFGAIILLFCIPLIGETASTFVSILFIFIIRLLASKYRWNLPKVIMPEHIMASKYNDKIK